MAGNNSRHDASRAGMTGMRQTLRRIAAFSCVGTPMKIPCGQHVARRTPLMPHRAQYRKIRIVADALNGPIFGGPNDFSTASSITL